MALVDRHIAKKNEHLSPVNSIKYYRLIQYPFSEKTGELTPSLKIKRKIIIEKYRDLIESMYPKGKT
ncbi:MAG: hypothetical protein A2V65_08930 [Deltaproteobacteria bacterium RBG_13_49_15]|nr:MAG: hypothetical protein A2V65_08930 [Deltaproteobacteria bacterium RBG_13_49_15]